MSGAYSRPTLQWLNEEKFLTESQASRLCVYIETFPNCFDQASRDHGAFLDQGDLILVLTRVECVLCCHVMYPYRTGVQHPSTSDIRQLDQQRALLPRIESPQSGKFVSRVPKRRSVDEIEVKVPQQSAQDKPQLDISQIPPDAAAWTQREGL